MRQRKSLELINNYQLMINYQLGKAKVVADGSSRKSKANLAMILTTQRHILVDMMKLYLDVQIRRSGALLMNIQDQTTLVDQMKSQQFKDLEL